MGRCKVRIHRLTLAPGDLENMARHVKQEGLAEEEACIRDRELLHNALEVSIMRSSARKIRPHVHGVGSGIGGRFWTSGCDSNTDEDETIMVDDLVSSMRNLSITSPAKQPTLESVLPSPVTEEGLSSISSVKEAAASSNCDRNPKIMTDVDRLVRNSHRPWEGPLQHQGFRRRCHWEMPFRRPTCDIPLYDSREGGRDSMLDPRCMAMPAGGAV
jgi:hypothetical protein